MRVEVALSSWASLQPLVLRVVEHSTASSVEFSFSPGSFAYEWPATWRGIPGMIMRNTVCFMWTLVCMHSAKCMYCI